MYLSLCLAVALMVTACQGDKPANTATTPNAQTAAPAAPAAPATANAGVEHYTCPNGHVGYGSATQGTWSQCGTALVHNQAYHNNASTAAPQAQPPMFQNQPAGATPAAPATAEPPQNAAGVWHYTCSAGCAGGAGAAGTCSQCGATLAHNQAYHN